MQEGVGPSHPTLLLIIHASPFSLRVDMAGQRLCVNEHRMNNDFTALSVLTDEVSVTPDVVREPGEQLWPWGLSVSSLLKSWGLQQRRHTSYFWASISPLPAAFPSLCLSSFLPMALKSPPICQAPLNTKELGGPGSGRPREGEGVWTPKNSSAKYDCFPDTDGSLLDPDTLVHPVSPPLDIFSFLSCPTPAKFPAYSHLCGQDWSVLWSLKPGVAAFVSEYTLDSRIWGYSSASFVTGHPPLSVPNFTLFPARSPESPSSHLPFCLPGDPLAPCHAILSPLWLFAPCKLFLCCFADPSTSATNEGGTSQARCWPSWLLAASPQHGTMV